MKKLLILFITLFTAIPVFSMEVDLTKVGHQQKYINEIGFRILNSQNMMKRRFKPALALAGIDSIRFHDLRHTYASTLIIQQVPLPYISKQLGHSTNKVTLDTYIHLMPESAQFGDSLLENLYEIRDAEQEESNVKRFGT